MRRLQSRKLTCKAFKLQHGARRLRFGITTATATLAAAAGRGLRLTVP
jgi:hypothetical protein